MQKNSFETSSLNDSIEFIAHRGLEHAAPENTWAAFEKAANMGYSSLEIDIQLTADDKMAIFHDNELDRTSNGSGPLRHWKWSSLKNLDVGSWFDSSFSAERIPRLDKLLPFFASRFKGYLYLDVKPSPHWNCSNLRVLIDLLLKNQLLERVYFCSFDHQLVEKVSLLNCNLKIAFSIETKTEYDQALKLPTTSAIVMNHGFFTPKIWQDFKNFEIILWTFRSSEQLEPFYQQGVRRFISSFDLDQTFLKKNIR
jgi:glycerophosphoryl diester phosphodiesterase